MCGSSSEGAHIGGNAHDALDEHGILIHTYGPHIFHTNDEEVFRFLSRFTKWRPYTHKVAASVHGRLIPVPFNLRSLRLVFGEEAEMLTKRLKAAYGEETSVSILADDAKRRSADQDGRPLCL